MLRTAYSLALAAVLVFACATQNVTPAQPQQRPGPPVREFNDDTTQNNIAPAATPAGPATGSPAAGSRQLAATIDVPGAQRWTDTNLDVQPGDHVTFSASGTVQYMDARPNGPEGLPRGWKDLLRVLPVNSLGRGALVGRVGEAGDAFVVGAQREFQVTHGGRLFLGINQLATESATGGFKVEVKIAAGQGKVVAISDSPMLAQLTADAFDKLPRRVTDPDGHPGDMVNFLILGSEDTMRLTLESAGWVPVDRTTKDAIMHGLMSSLSKEAYVEMPMSTLTLFDRPQDYGYAHAEPLTVALTRHHFRIWKAPFTIGGETVWVGAGTHDVGLERDQRNGKLTHKIDPAIDEERTYIAQTLNSTGMVFSGGYVKPANAFTGGTTATGGSFQSDGRVLVLMLAPSGRDASAVFADIFCSVLGRENPDGGRWGDCSQYLKTTGKTAELTPIANKYRVLVLPGFFSACVTSTQAMQKGAAHLHDVHGIDVEYLPLPNASSEDNGKAIADYVATHSANDQRKYILVGYSKGAPDAQVAIENYPQARGGIAAFVSLAGAVGGSPVADTLPAVIDKYAKALNLGSCQGSLSDAARSLRSDVRHNFLSLHPAPSVPSYSFTAFSDKKNTSKMLLQAWQILSAYDAEQDSQMTRQDAFVPGSTFLGTAKADHLAVALAFEDSSDASVKSLMDKNHYPRAALFEALVRAVVADLEKTSKPAGGN